MNPKLRALERSLSLVTQQEALGTKLGNTSIKGALEILIDTVHSADEAVAERDAAKAEAAELKKAFTTLQQQVLSGKDEMMAKLKATMDESKKEAAAMQAEHMAEAKETQALVTALVQELAEGKANIAIAEAKVVAAERMCATYEKQMAKMKMPVAAAPAKQMVMPQQKVLKDLNAHIQRDELGRIVNVSYTPVY
jgi:hypothetical protein